MKGFPVLDYTLQIFVGFYPVSHILKKAHGPHHLPLNTFPTIKKLEQNSVYQHIDLNWPSESGGEDF